MRLWGGRHSWASTSQSRRRGRAVSSACSRAFGWPRLPLAKSRVRGSVASEHLWLDPHRYAHTGVPRSASAGACEHRGGHCRDATEEAAEGDDARGATTHRARRCARPCRSPRRGYAASRVSPGVGKDRFVVEREGVGRRSAWKHVRLVAQHQVPPPGRICLPLYVGRETELDGCMSLDRVSRARTGDLLTTL
jgi:hypothetical protein